MKVLLTCKELKGWIDTDHYWTRVSVHLTCRGCEWMELHSTDSPEEDDVLEPLPDVNLYYLIGMDQGYYWGMERFLLRLQEAINFHSKNLNDEQGRWLAEVLATPTLREKTVKMYMENLERSQGGWCCSLPKLRGDEKTIPMKELAKRITERDWVQGRQGKLRKKMKTFLCKMEDHPMPASFKRFFSRGMYSLIWDAMTIKGEEICPTEMAMEIFLF
jgi:hypothetical protein